VEGHGACGVGLVGGSYLLLNANQNLQINFQNLFTHEVVAGEIGLDVLACIAELVVEVSKGEVFAVEVALNCAGELDAVGSCMGKTTGALAFGTSIAGLAVSFGFIFSCGVAVMFCCGGVKGTFGLVIATGLGDGVEASIQLDSKLFNL
jgi:hypothetical protein